MKILLDSEFATETISNKKVWENERLGTDMWWWQATDDWLHLFIYHELARETQIAFIWTIYTQFIVFPPQQATDVLSKNDWAWR